MSGDEKASPARTAGAAEVDAASVDLAAAQKRGPETVMTDVPATPDAVRGNWVDAYAPRAWRPALRMMRADRPIGGWLLALPGLQGLALAGGAAEWRFDRLAVETWLGVAWLVAAFFVGAFLMRAAGCVLNDIVDRDIDAQVARTAARPLPSGQISLRGALILLVALTLIGLAILASFNRFAIVVGLCAALPVIVYPFMKRITWWPQAFLGIAFSWGALLSEAALTGTITWLSGFLYAASIVWTIGYDTIYAHQDREDDELVGVRSTARLFGDQSRLLVGVFYAFAVLLAAAAGVIGELGFLFWFGLAGFAAHLAGQVIRLNIDDPTLCLHLFRSNRDAGLLLLAGFIGGGL